MFILFLLILTFKAVKYFILSIIKNIMENSLTFYELTAHYVHESDWTSKFMDVDKFHLQISPFNSFLSSEGEVEVSTVRVSSKDVLKTLQKVLRSHWKIKRVLFLYPINDGYPKILKLGVIGDLRDTIRATAYTLGAIADTSLYYEGKEFWSILFTQEYGIDGMRRYMEMHGKVLDLNVRKTKMPDILSKYEFKDFSILTPREAEILKIAYKEGLFEYPKKNNIDSVARNIGITKSSFNEILRKALKKILKTVNDSLEDF